MFAALLNVSLATDRVCEPVAPSVVPGIGIRNVSCERAWAKSCLPMLYVSEPGA